MPQSTALSVDLLLDRVHGDVKALAGALQAQIDDPSRQQQVGATLSDEAPGSVKVVYDAQGNWAQNLPGAPSVVSVWGYLLGADHTPLPGVQKEIEDSTVIDLVAPTSWPAGRPNCRCTILAQKNGRSQDGSVYGPGADLRQALSGPQQGGVLGVLLSGYLWFMAAMGQGSCLPSGP